ncbi:branched-chain amino acid ABC transporter permease [Oceanobacillus sp. CF4.6]|uniref:branched-chain amino acid ABC transporter permease n=1 Tax=Oceanobacillus sp. CF4.6 TaxID=3373080 RepID=UPI003EE75A13
MKKTSNKLIALILLAIILVAFPFVVGMSNYWMTLVVLATIYGITAVALNLLIGYGGQISIGHAGFLMIGAYVVAILTDRFNFPFIINFFLAGVITAIIGLLVGLAALRLKGHFLAVVTLGFGMSVPIIALNWNSLTNGYSGMLVRKPEILSSSLNLYLFIIICAFLFIWFMYNFVNSSVGRAFSSIRESEVAAQSSGVNITYYKATMFTISAFFTGLAGGLYAYWIGFVGPTDFPVTTSFLLLAMIIVGGMYTFIGPIIGSVLFSVIPHFTDPFPGITNVVIGFTLVFVILLKPEGLATLLDHFKKKKKSSSESTLKERSS